MALRIEFAARVKSAGGLGTSTIERSEDAAEFLDELEATDLCLVGGIFLRLPAAAGLRAIKGEVGIDGFVTFPPNNEGVSFLAR